MTNDSYDPDWIMNHMATISIPSSVEFSESELKTTLLDTLNK